MCRKMTCAFRPLRSKFSKISAPGAAGTFWKLASGPWRCGVRVLSRKFAFGHFGVPRCAVDSLAGESLFVEEKEKGMCSLKAKVSGCCGYLTEYFGFVMACVCHVIRWRCTAQAQYGLVWGLNIYWQYVWETLLLDKLAGKLKGVYIKIHNEAPTFEHKILVKYIWS